MTNSSPGTPNSSQLGQPAQQAIDSVQGQAIAQMLGGFAIGQLTVYLSQVATDGLASPAPTSTDLGPNPYKGLKAFYERDADRFFGREAQIQKLRERFQRLHDDRATVRVLPIYGPSGSGKSSLARAGLLPALGNQPLPGRERARVAVLTPGSHPLAALSKVLARIATNDPAPVAKTKEFEEALRQHPGFDGLHYIADVLPDIENSPLIVLVDQFEELYTLCDHQDDRRTFVENLLSAASDRDQRVSVILTMRSDFLGATQQHPRLNSLFSSPGFLVPIMQPEELAIAIAEPAKRAGHPFDPATIDLLLEQSAGHEGTLPLLQFALSQIWEGLRNGVEPVVTLKQIGGVGGALAGEAKRRYESLSPERQKIARSTFLALIQLNKDNEYTRRRVLISELITRQQDTPLVREVINCFAEPGVWILVTSANEQRIEMVEIAHEALIRNWTELKDWLNTHGQALRQKRKIEQAAEEWEENQKKSDYDYFLQDRSLRDAEEFLAAHKDKTETALSTLAIEFVKVSAKKKIIANLKIASIALIFPLIGVMTLTHLEITRRANLILSHDNCTADSGIQWYLKYMWFTRQPLKDSKLCNEDLGGIELPKLVIENANFKEANLSNTNFREASLPGAKFNCAILPEADFSGSNKSPTLLMDADFRCTNSNLAIKKIALMGVNFQNSNLRGAKFQNTYLQKVDFRGADLTNANFSGAKNLTLEELKEATLCNTILPENLTKLRNRDCSTKDDSR